MSHTTLHIYILQLYMSYTALQLYMYHIALHLYVHVLVLQLYHSFYFSELC